MHLEVVFVSVGFPCGTDRNRIIRHFQHFREEQTSWMVWALAYFFFFVKSSLKCVNEIKLYTVSPWVKLVVLICWVAVNMNKLENTHSVNGLNAQRLHFGPNAINSFHLIIYREFSRSSIVFPFHRHRYIFDAINSHNKICMRREKKRKKKKYSAHIIKLVGRHTHGEAHICIHMILIIKRSINATHFNRTGKWKKKKKQFAGHNVK